jgi:hypothetical protein
MATLPFIAATTAKEQGHDLIVWLWNEAVTTAASLSDESSCSRDGG